MGYYSTIMGEITFDPPASAKEIREIEASQDPNWTYFQFDVDQETIDTDEGTLTKRSADSIVRVTDDSTKAYRVEEDLELFAKGLPGRTWTGEFRILGEETGDISRLFIAYSGDTDDAKVTRWTAKLIWPDGTEEDAR